MMDFKQEGELNCCSPELLMVMVFIAATGTN